MSGSIKKLEVPIGFITPRNGTYRARWYEQGRQRSRGFPTEQDAADFLMQKHAELEKYRKLREIAPELVPDIAFCYAEHQGDDGQIYRVRTCGSNNTHYPVDPVHLNNVACSVQGVTKVHNNNHYHIRFVGRYDALPSDVCP